MPKLPGPELRVCGGAAWLIWWSSVGYMVEQNGLYGCAKSFSHHQVRSLVGSLKMVGDGSWSIYDFDNALKSKNRSKCGALAPSEGLYFMEVKY